MNFIGMNARRLAASGFAFAIPVSACEQTATTGWRRTIKNTFALLLALYSGTALADTTIIENGCLKYLDTGKVYNGRVSIVDGKDLWPKYSWANVLTKYAIVFWDKDEATVIDISVFGLILDTGVEGTDLQGRRWKVAKQPWC